MTRSGPLSALLFGSFLAVFAGLGTPSRGAAASDPPVGGAIDHSTMDHSRMDHGGHSMPAEGEHEQHRKMLADGSSKAPESVEGLTVPDVTVVDQDGRTRRFYTDLVQGRTVALNFIFTTCTTICPPMGANFAKLQTLLGDRLGREVFLVSVSVDPTVDTPQRMKEWGGMFGAAPGWTLVTGEREQILQLLKTLGVYTPDKADHSPLVLLGNEANHRWTRTYGLTTPAKLAELLGEIGRGSGANAHAGGME